MALKKKKLKINETIPLHLRIKRNLLKKHNKPNYALLFETMSKNDFINYIFNTPYFAIHFSQEWRQSYLFYMKRLNRLYNYMDLDDIYAYIAINHLLNKSSNELQYKSSFFKLFTDLFSQIPEENFEELSYSDTASYPEYVYGYAITKTKDKSLLVMAREFFLYGKATRQMKIEGLNNTELIKRLRQIYQEGLTPIDISEISYLF